MREKNQKVKDMRHIQQRLAGLTASILICQGRPHLSSLKNCPLLLRANTHSTTDIPTMAIFVLFLAIFVPPIKDIIVIKYNFMKHDIFVTG